MRAIRVIIMVLGVLLVLGVNAFATDEPKLYSADEFGVDGVLDALPDGVREDLPDGAVFGADGFSEKFSIEYFFTLIKKFLLSALTPALKTLSSLMALVILASLLSALSKSIGNASLVSAFELASGLCLMLTVYTTVSSLAKAVEQYLTALTGVVSALVPVSVAINTAGGNISGASATGSAMMVGLSFVEILASRGLYPILPLCFGLAVASGVGGVSLGAVSKSVRGVFTWVLGFISAVISAVMTFQTSIAARADSLSMRAVKFAASNSVPVAGGIASEAVSTVASSLALVKGSVGWTGVIIILLMTLPVILNVITVRLAIVAAQTVADVLGLQKEKGILEEGAGLLGFLAAVCVIAALMFVYALAVFAKDAVALC